MQAVAEGAGLVASEHFLRSASCLAGPPQELGRLEPLRRLRGAAIDDPHDDVGIQRHTDAELNRFGFDRLLSARGSLFSGLCFGNLFLSVLFIGAQV